MVVAVADGIAADAVVGLLLCHGQLISGGDIASLYTAEERVEIADMIVDDAISDSYFNGPFSPVTRGQSLVLSQL